MSEFKIEKGIPLGGPGRNRCKYPLRDLEIGDSFLVVDCDSSVLRTCISLFSKRNPGYKFSTRKEGTGIRVWRIAAK